MKKGKKEIIARVKTVTSVPASALQAMRVLQDPNANMGEVVQIISYDPGLTSNILKLANSSYFGCSHEISTLRDAIVRLGSGNIFKLVTTTVANAALNKNMRGYGFKSGELWEHSMAVAVASENLSALINSENTRIAFTAGLLHDIGKIILCDFIDRETRDEILEKVKTGKTFEEMEKEIFSINHAALGSRLLRYWNIPQNLCDSVGWHHEPDKIPDFDVSSIVHIADIICLSNRIGSREGLLHTHPSPQTLKRIGLTNQIKEEVIARTKDSFDKIKDIFSKH